MTDWIGVDMNYPTCDFDGCERQARAKKGGLCSAHQYKLWKTGKLSELKIRNPAIWCTFADCGKKSKANGLCSAHDQQVRRGKDLSPLVSKSPRQDGCFVPGCQRPWFSLLGCQRHWRWQRQYGLSVERIFEMLKDPRCQICGFDEDPDKLSIDHRHGHHNDPEMGCEVCVRGFLCQGCNVGLGYFAEDVEKLRAAIVYLEKHSSM